MKNYEELKSLVFENIIKNKEEAIKINDYLSLNPEVSGSEQGSAKHIVEYLKEVGYDVEFPFCGLDTAFKAVYGKNNKTRKIAFMVEYDALPEIGHACGHCTSAAISILAGVALKDLSEELDADIHIIGTPDEEAYGHKITLIDKGVFDEYDLASMVHLYSENMVKLVVQALDAYIITFKGKTAHGAAAPWEGRNALNGVQLFFHATDMLRQHVKPDVRMHGIIRNGGTMANIVPEEATAEFFVRSADRVYLDKVAKKVEKCALGAAMATDTEVDFKLWGPKFDDLKENLTGERTLREAYEEIGLEVVEPTSAFGSTDAGNVSYVCPTFHPTIQIAKSKPVIHTREFEECTRTEEAYEAIENGSKVMALQVLKIFTDAEKYKQLKSDFFDK